MKLPNYVVWTTLGIMLVNEGISLVICSIYILFSVLWICWISVDVVTVCPVI